MTHYFLELGYNTALNNKLKKAAHDYLKTLHGKLMISSDIDNFKGIVIAQIEKINAENNRCTPLKVVWWENRHKGKGCFSLSGFGEVNFHIHPATLTRFTHPEYRSLSNN